MAGGGVKIYNNGCAGIKTNCAGNNNNLIIGRNSTIHNLNLYIRGNSVRIEIGDGVII